MRVHIKRLSILLLLVVICFYPSDANAASTYKLNKTVKVYSNASDAKNRKSPKLNYSSGTYYIYKTHNGMINISRNKGVPGAWINPADNTNVVAKSTQAPKQTPKPQSTPVTASKKTIEVSASTVKLNASINAYTNANDAKHNKYTNRKYSAGTYHIYKKFDGMINITRTKGVPGAWINPNNSTKTTVTTYSARPDLYFMGDSIAYGLQNANKTKTNHKNTVIGATINAIISNNKGKVAGKRVIISAGINDISHGKVVTAKDIDNIMAIIPKDSEVIWMNYYWTKGNQNLIRTSNNNLNKATSKYKNLKVFNWNSIAKNRLSSDGLHVRDYGSLLKLIVK